MKASVKPHVTELPFRTGILLGCCTALSACECCVKSTIWQETITWGSFCGFKSKCLFRMNLMHGNTENIPHVPTLTWPGMMSSLTSHGLVDDITQHFCLNSFLVLSFDTKISHLKRRWKTSRANKCYRNLPFISIDVSSRNTIPLKTFPWMCAHPNSMKKYYYIWFIKCSK